MKDSTRGRRTIREACSKILGATELRSILGSASGLGAPSFCSDPIRSLLSFLDALQFNILVMSTLPYTSLALRSTFTPRLAGHCVRLSFISLVLSLLEQSYGVIGLTIRTHIIGNSDLLSLKTIIFLSLSQSFMSPSEKILHVPR